MYAIIKSGGSQYRVMAGEVLRVARMKAEPGDEISFDDILMLGGEDGEIRLGDDLNGAKVTAKVTAHGRAKKIRIIKFRRRKHHMKRMGHRQDFTVIEILGVNGAEKTKAKAAAKAASPASGEEE